MTAIGLVGALIVSFHPWPILSDGGSRANVFSIGVILATGTPITLQVDPLETISNHLPSRDALLPVIELGRLQ